MVDTDDSSILFNDIINDMKNGLPLFEEVLMKGTKFYAAIKQTAITGDGFLDSLQRLADVITNSKGAAKDIGVSFTKIVMRHKAIEAKLKTYVGIFADNFLTPFQETLDEWKKNTSQLEKDHTKDYKRLKGDLKKANSDAVKLKKKASKKFDRQEYTEQYKDATRISNSLCKTLEDQEKVYLRKIMVEERARACQFFRFFQPCIEQEMTLISEIENLDSILVETRKQCNDPKQLPVVSEELVEGYKVPDSLIPGNKDLSSAVSSPTSPVLVKDCSLPLHHMGTIQRQYSMSGYSNDFDPAPINIPTTIWPSSCTDNLSGSSYSSASSSHDHPTGLQLVQNPMNLNNLRLNSPEGHGSQCNYSSTDCKDNLRHHNYANVHHALKTRTSWSSTETSDSSGIGSYHSLNSHQRRLNSTSQVIPQYLGGSDCDMIESDYSTVYDVNVFPPPPPIVKMNNPQIASHSYSNGSMKYATIDRSHFKKKQFYVGHPVQDFYTMKQRSNSLGENTEDYPSFPDYKMNLPKSKVNTIAGTRYQMSDNVRANMFNLFGGQSPANGRNTNPKASPLRKIPPEIGRVSITCTPHFDKKPSGCRERIGSATLPRAHTTDNDPDPAKPGSFEAALQAQRRNFIKRRSLSVDQSPMNYQYIATNL